MNTTGLIELTQIDGVRNLFCPNDKLDSLGLNKLTLEQIELFKSLTEQRLSLADLESSLRFAFGAGETIMTSKSVRFATCIGWKNSQLHRNANNIILPGTDMVNNPQIQNNIGNNVVDPIGWASRPAAPDKKYGLLGKIPAFRGTEGNNDFNKELYAELFNTIVDVGEISGYAVEIKDSETAIMPVVAITGGEDIILPFSEELMPGDIKTAKHFALNR